MIAVDLGSISRIDSLGIETIKKKENPLSRVLFAYITSQSAYT
jgi:hypothetical protein